MSIVITDLCKSFGNTPVLQRFTWTVDRPMVLMGRSGCGKTTLLRILLGLESADSGTVTGVETPAAVFQEDRLCPQLTAAANLTLTGHGLTPQDAERELRALGFTDAELALPAARLSGGQKRRAALLRALLCRDAKMLLLDEPFTGMDAELVEDAVAATKRLAGERPTILVTHDRTAADADNSVYIARHVPINGFSHLIRRFPAAVFFLEKDVAGQIQFLEIRIENILIGNNQVLRPQLKLSGKVPARIVRINRRFKL